ncbi:MAG: hypothetical protein EHM43_04950, partial [Ignavibacteriae bacterium]
MQNFKTLVFSKQVTSVEEDVVSTCLAAPQPASESVTLTAEGLAGATVTVIDLAGQSLQTTLATDDAVTL